MKNHHVSSFSMVFIHRVMLIQATAEDVEAILAFAQTDGRKTMGASWPCENHEKWWLNHEKCCFHHLKHVV